ncbi:hypothetical protein [Leucobacter chromiisoli]|uniref:hypothetical protein n=1 Tax=Leucobacter chromiisoli TaxID=2796471 RepID=UPI001F1A889E|nr:hypothetical protein [Leucobacter chromiisoli]
MARAFSLTAMSAQAALAVRALRTWSPRQYGIAAVVTVVFGMLVGIVTVLIPNPWFMRDIDTVWWNYPVWILTSIGAGLLTATYVRRGSRQAEQSTVEDDRETPAARRSARMGIAGGMLTWFAVGCPVCNKIALLALGYSGAITWFAPFQPVLAIAALLLTWVALVWRLSGQVACPLSGSAMTGYRITSSPSSAMPAPSHPSTMGMRSAGCPTPRNVKTSCGFSVAAWTRTRAQPSRDRGSG